uniref:Receptor-type tyrosine-protein phosphatase N2 n=1 Tax=Trichogramma kaykai TaxID=54128 RepID=A0ABD2WIF4_9HYME
MGLKGWREGAEARPAATHLQLLLLLGLFLRSASSYGEVGCLFSKNLCKPEIESFCYNDLAFGRCIQLSNGITEAYLYKYDLALEELELLRAQLERLEYEGYKWSHYYTQCVMQILLDNLRDRLNNDAKSMCKHLKYYKTKDDESEDGIVDGDAFVQSRVKDPIEAVVKFAPSQITPQDYADEVYYTSDSKQKFNDNAQLHELQQLQHHLQQQQQQQQQDSSNFGDYGDRFIEKLGRSENEYHRGSRSLNSKPNLQAKAALTYAQVADYPVSPEYVEALRRFLDNEVNLFQQQAKDENLEFLPRDAIVTDEQSFSSKYKYPKEFFEQQFSDYEDISDEDAELESDDEDNEEDNQQEHQRQKLVKNALKPVIDALAQHQGSGSGFIDDDDDITILPAFRGNADPTDDEMQLNDDLNGLLWRRELAGFKRRERLDVKKPGPQYATNNFAFKIQSTYSPDEDENYHDSSKLLDNGQNVLLEKKEILTVPNAQKDFYNLKLNLSKTYENVDLDYVYIQFNQEFHSWSEGERIVNMVGSLLGLRPGELKDIRVGRAEITFKVPRNSKDYNATDIVSKIGEDDIRKDLHSQLNIEVIRAGIGDKTKLPAILEVSKREEMNPGLFSALVVTGVAGVTAASIVVLIIARRHAKARAKLAGLRTPDPEASKDYQELCRARMQAKQVDKLSESPRGFDFGRLIESGRNESIRSSTSSWNEEPPVSNMDIATGHIVLSYMEEHLKNQTKLDEEWAALSSYEAEPCSTAIATAEGNAELNRPGAALPYDHSRVILNDLANVNNSDYINASTITDHDPRNPAYIATQGPLPKTAADFWQLVWEQGSVVIVMLTRLVEDGKAMCFRYWPDEGSDQYNLFEVHMVSEHIWCDDYLVRSFYLKNLRSGETRTVTQFHFLTWPQDSLPKSTKSLLEFRRKVNKAYRGRSCPIIVHCSDGAGRTGTYCLIDMVLNRMSKGAKEIDIATTLEHIRDQRSGMVANKQQFEFALMAVAEEVHAILKSLPIVAAEKANNSKSTAKSDK